MAKILDQIEKRQDEQQNMLDLHDLILNGKPMHEIPGLVQEHKKTRAMTDEHDDYIKKQKWQEKLLIAAGGMIGGALVALFVKFLETNLLK